MNNCVWENCDKEQLKRSLCNQHYQLANRLGRLNEFPKIDRRIYKICSIDGCGQKHRAKGYCDKHWQKYGTKRCKIENCTRAAQKDQICSYHKRRIDRGLPFNAEFGLGTLGRKICEYENCDRFVSGKGFCSFHRKRQRDGVPLNAPRKNRYSENDFCKAFECSERPYSAGYCKFHYGRKHKGLEINKPKQISKSLSFIPLLTEIESLGWYKNFQGYLSTRIRGKTILQHRAIWEAHNGRKLHPFENVHHINGIRDDNRIENLELWTKPQPCGQRPEDLVAWVLEHYREEILQKIDTRVELPL